MKYILAAAVVGLGVAPAHAQQTTQQHCSAVSVIAEIVMQSHQNGVAMTETMGNLGDTVPDMIVAAYDRPRFKTADARGRAIAEFRDEMTVACYKGEVRLPPSAFVDEVPAE